MDETTGKICLRFFEKVLTGNGQLSNTTVAFDGTLGVQDKPDDGRIEFEIDNSTISLLMQAGYELEKVAGVPYYSTGASSYLVDYTVTLKLDQDVQLSGSKDLYTAALTLVDSVEANGALLGEIYGDAAVTEPEGETVTANITSNGTVNTLTLSSPDQILNKGTYTFVYKMKINPAAALVRLSGYTDEQKTNTVELKENGKSFKPEKLTAAAKIAWDKETETQFKIDKNVFTEKAPHYQGVYMDEKTGKYYADFHVVVYLREDTKTFTVTDVLQSGCSFRSDADVTLEGVDTSTDYWNSDIGSTATLTEVAATVTSEINNASEMEITVTAPEASTFAPGAYHLRIPVEVTSAVIGADGKVNPQSFSNTAKLVRVDNKPANESKTYTQEIPNPAETRKDGGYSVNEQTGEIISYEGKPVIRWDVWIGWDFYNKTTFEDTLTGMKLLVNSEYPFDIHSFTDQDSFKETLATVTSLTDNDYLNFNEDGTAFVFNNEKLYTNKDDNGSPVKLYKLVYFTTPLDAENGQGDVVTGLNNHYEVTYTTPDGTGFGTNPEGDVVPNMVAAGRLWVKKAHVIERTDKLT